jgi:hypothetical protein
MAALSAWIPMRWPAGPLDISQREKKQGFTARSKEVLQRWLDPSMLEILQGTPVNCPVVSWAAGLPADAEQQQALAPLLAQGKTAGLSFVGLVEGDANKAAAVASARAAGLAAVIMEGEVPNAGLPILPLAASPHLPWNSSSPVLVAKGNVWPGVASMGLNSQDWRPGRDSQASGPTSEPWIDSNGWFLRLSKVYAPSKTTWLLFDPPGGPNVILADAYLRAIADSGSFCGRWILSLDDALRASLAQKEQRAMATWKSIAAALAFFARHSQWETNSPVGLVGVVSDFAGANETIGTETLNLMVRSNVPFRIVQKSKLATAPLTGYKALISVDAALPEPAARKRLLDFAQRGGALLVSQCWKGQGGTPTGVAHPRLDLRKLGKGKFAVCKDDSPDPYMVARDIHVLLSRFNDLSRFFNLSAFLSAHTAAPGGASALLQITNFANANRFSVSQVTVWFPQQYRAARMWTLGSEASVELKLEPENTGMDVQIPAVSPYAAIEVALQKLA